ncbi:MAG: calcium/sodium antiporter [Velocimicrobium sp.]
MMYVWLIIGFVLLIKGADYFVEGSSGVAKKFHVPTMIIGLTIVAMGTSAPECAVSIAAALKGNNEIAISNIIGSNMFNLVVVCGICAILSPLLIDKKTLKVEFPMAIGAGVLLLVLASDNIYRGKTAINVLGRLDGIILLVLFVLFLAWMVLSAKVARRQMEEMVEDKTLSGIKCLVFILGGIIAIVVGGDLVVDSASDIASTFGLSQTLIGLTIVSIGTSLPELVTSLVAAKKGEVDMALGNVIGSNLFNILLVLGISSTIAPITVASTSQIDLIILTVMSLIIYLIAAKKSKIERRDGIVMLLMYVSYMYYICVR